MSPTVAQSNTAICPSVSLSVSLSVPFARLLRGMPASPLQTHSLEWWNSQRGSVFIWRRCDTLRTSGFADDVTFVHNLPGLGGLPGMETFIYLKLILVCRTQNRHKIVMFTENRSQSTANKPTCQITKIHHTHQKRRIAILLACSF